MLAWVIANHWLALVRDVLALGYRARDMFTTLTLAEMVAIAVAAPPTSSVRFFLDEGWSRTDHLLANMQEGQAGLADLKQPYERPGLAEGRPDWGSSGNKLFHGDAMTWDEMDELDRKKAAYAAELAAKGITPKNSKVRTF